MARVLVSAVAAILVCAVEYAYASCGLSLLPTYTQVVLFHDSFDLRYPSPNPSFPSSYSFQGLKLQLTSAGLAQVVETASNLVVFEWGLTGKNCNPTSTSKGCRLIFQSDGNLVIYYPDGSGIGTSTYNQNADLAIFSTSPPYLSIVSSGSCTVLWPNAQNKPNWTPKARTTPIAGPTITIPSATVTALPALKWKSSFGVNTHMSQGWSSSMVYNLTTYLGAGVIRDHIPSASQAADYARMYTAGIRLNVVAGGAQDKNALTQQVQTFSNFVTSQPGMLLQIEGFNEINNFGFDYNGFDHTKTYQGMAQAQSDLYSLVKATPNLASIPVLDLTGGNFADGAKFGLTNFVGHADFGNIHPYPYGGNQITSLGNTQNYFLWNMGGSYPAYTQSPSTFVATETGYHTSNFSNGVTEAAHAKMIVNLLLNGISLGIRQTFIYEEIDEVWAGYDGQESHFGLFRNNQTPKPGARALHFLSGLLKDTSSPSPLGTLSYSLKGVPVGTQSLLFQNSARSFFVVVWTNTPVWNYLTKSDISNPTVQATLSLSASAKVSVYDIYSTTADDTKPLTPLSTVTSSNVNFSMSDKVVVLSVN